jgi:C4-dicarboxylate-specific signal transduction histidine kinase
VQETSRQVDKATAIIRRLRDFGRKSDLSRDRLSINRPIRNVLEILGKQLELQNIEVEIALGEQIQPISAHRNRIEQVVFNLLTNARDALNQKAETGTGTDRRWIRIRTYQKDGQAVLEVSDNGTGIPEAVRSRIFESFFTTKEMGEGMGLGLSISYGIVEDYGGQIRVESREGKGTTFTLMFPTISGGRGAEPV